MERNTLYYVGPFLGGVLFAIGLGLSGMLEPAKIIGFLDVFGDWDPSLIFVMIGAIAVHGVLYRVIMKQPHPIFDTKFHVPKRTELDGKLIGGAAIFGAGWAIAGLCPGPGIVSLVSGHEYILVFIAALTVGALAGRLVDRG